MSLYNKSNGVINRVLFKDIVLRPLAVKIGQILWFSGLTLIALPSAQAQEYFNPALLSLGVDGDISSNVADLSVFEKGRQPPGEYHVQLVVNNRVIGERKLTFTNDKDGNLIPQLTLKQYQAIGLRTQAVPSLAGAADDTLISDIREVLPGATVRFDYASQRVELTFPQLYSERRSEFEADAEQWDQGMPAALLNYSLSGNQTKSSGNGNQSSIYSNLRGGINLGAWRLRSYATYQHTARAGAAASDSFNLISTYLQRDIHTIKGQLIVGDSATPADVFDSVQFQGGQLISDEGMLPSTQRGYAPVVRGVVESGAEITIRQNGNVIYQSYVPPGPFAIDDLYPATMSGDLEVIIKESDGSERRFIQPFSSLAIMQREGQLKYAAVAGKLRNSGSSANTNHARFIQGTLVYGLPGSVTLYGGMQLAKQFMAASVGVGVGLGKLGALSADVTHSGMTLPHRDKSQGQSYRLRYSQSLAETNTTLSLAAYRYSTEGYYSLEDAFSDPGKSNFNNRYRPRGEFQVMLNQSLGPAGSIYASGSQRNYWTKSGELRTWALGYNTNLYGISYGLNFSQSQDTDSGREDRRVAFNIAVPLSRWLSGGANNSVYANYALTSSNGQGANQQAGISGSAMEDNQLNYNLSQSYANKDNSHSTALSGTYSGSAGTLSAGFNRSPSQQQINYGLRGGIVAHPYGVTLSQDLGETIALIRAPGASDLKVGNQTGLRTDTFGQAIMPWVIPYQRTEISLNPKGLKPTVTLGKTTASVTPTRGAVVLAEYPTQRGHQVMITLKNEQGKFVPFGATARLLNSQNKEPSTGIVGDDGLLYISGMPDSGSMELTWGKGGDNTCQVRFNLEAAIKNQLDGVPLQTESICQRN
ncbi:fimbria/pilus outer membrane usher protein [Pantoea sp. SGAir0175]